VTLNAAILVYCAKKFQGLYSIAALAGKYISYWIRASNGKGHGTHSPFVFDFIRNVLNDKREFYPYRDIELLRSVLLKDRTFLEVEDYGAGSARGGAGRRCVADIARYGAKSPKYAQLLFRIAHYYQPGTIIEMGTSLGISTAYLASANKSTKVITIEGSSAVADRAEKYFNGLSLGNIELKRGRFDQVLPLVLLEDPYPGMVFVDGNHRKDPTLEYFTLLMNGMAPSGVIVFDDIHWSREMEEAWSVIRADSRVMLTIDLFFMGLVFLRPDFKIKQDFLIRF
jgi:predicted O-methyltransferase YrrM